MISLNSKMLANPNNNRKKFMELFKVRRKQIFNNKIINLTKKNESIIYL